jgi:hypothetical protein
MRRSIFLPEQHQRHARAFQVLMQVHPVRDDPVGRQRGAPKQARCYRAVIEIVGERPRQPGGRGALEVSRHGAEAQPARLRDGALREPGRVFQAENVAKFSHR